MKPGQSAWVPLLTCPRKVCPFLPGIWENRRQKGKKNHIPPEKSHCQTTTITPHAPKHHNNNKIPLVWKSPNCCYTGTLDPHKPYNYSCGFLLTTKFEFLHLLLFMQLSSKQNSRIHLRVPSLLTWVIPLAAAAAVAAAAAATAVLAR